LAAACSVLAVLYEHGTGVGKDAARALALYKQACDGQVPAGCAHLARLYETGSGVAQDAARADVLYKQACAGQGASACWDLASRYAQGEGVPKDLGFAAAVYKAACMGGEAAACSSLGVMYESGSGVLKDAGRAAALYKQGCDGGDAHSCANLGDLYEHGKGVAPSADRAATLYKRACDAHDNFGCSGLAGLYLSGTGVPKDAARAALLYKQACEAEDLYACADLADLYATGVGVGKDVAQAATLRKRACDGAVASACGGPTASPRFRELRLVAVAQRGSARVAYLANARGDFWPATAGYEFFDATVASVDSDRVTFHGEGGSQQTHQLFEKGEPARLSFGPDSTGTPMSVDYDGDAATLAGIVADASGLNVIVEAGLAGEVRIAARDAPWDGLFARALAEGGFGYRLGGSVLLVGRRDRLDKLPLPSSPKWSGRPVSLSFHGADVRDLAHLFADISGLEVRLPAASCGSIAAFFHEVPWDEGFAWIVASCGWTYRIDGTVIQVEVSKGGTS